MSECQNWAGECSEPCGHCGEPTVTIPRAEHEALRAAAITIEEATKFDDDKWRDGWKAIRTMLSWQLAALRAAGIEQGDQAND